MPLPKRPHVASPDQVRITREGDAAIIEYAAPNVATTHFTIGREKLTRMTDAEILQLWNDGIAATDDLIANTEYIAQEIPPGRPQLKYFALGDQWVPRGGVLRGEILGESLDDPDAPFISFDGRDFTPHEFVRMMSTFGGWGVRITFVPRDALHEEPPMEVAEPEGEP